MCCGLLPNIHIKVFTSYDARTVTRSPAVYSGGKPHITQKKNQIPTKVETRGAFILTQKNAPPNSHCTR